LVGRLQQNGEGQRIEVLGGAGLGECALANAAIVDADPLEQAGQAGMSRNDISDPGRG
jgi:hypothetical protein